jgi:hypothetical protein
LAIELETAATCENIGPEGVEASCKISPLFVQHEQAGLVALLMFFGGAMELLGGVKNLEGKNGEAIDDEAGRLGMKRGRGLMGRELEEGDVDLFGEVVTALIEAINVVLDVDDGVVGGVGVAGVVFAVPEVVVGAVLVEDELVEGRRGCRNGGRGVVAVRGELVVEGDEVGGVEHGAVTARITEWELRW